MFVCCFVISTTLIYNYYTIYAHCVCYVNVKCVTYCKSIRYLRKKLYNLRNSIIYYTNIRAVFAFIRLIHIYKYSNKMRCEVSANNAFIYYTHITHIHIDIHTYTLIHIYTHCYIRLFAYVRIVIYIRIFIHIHTYTHMSI